MKRLTTVLLALLLAGAVWGATYYVDYVAGDDTNNGTATGTPWKHCPGDPQAANNPAAANIGATDTVLLKGGVVYALNNVAGILVAVARYANGATIKSGHLHGTPWGAGRAVIDGNDETDAGYAIKVSARASITIEGLEIRDIDVEGEDIAAVTLVNCTSTTLKNLVIHNIGGAAFQKQCIEVDASDTIADGNIVEYCELYDSTEKGVELYRSGGSIVRHNTIYQHTDHGIVLTSQYNEVYCNTIHDVSYTVKGRASEDPGFAIKVPSNSMPVGHNNIYNNVIYHSLSAFCIENLGTQDIEYVNFYENTCYDMGPEAESTYGFILLNVQSTGTINHCTIRNNIFSNVTEQGEHRPALRIQTASLGDNNTISHNLWYDPNAALTCLTYVGAGNQWPTLANFADSGSESPDYRFCRAELGTGNSFDDDPTQIFNESALMTDPANEDFTLQATSPCKDTGYTLGGQYDTDFTGAARPLGAAYDIGAYEYNPGGGGGFLIGGS